MSQSDIDLVYLLNQNGCLSVLSIQIRRKINRASGLKILAAIVKKYVNVKYASEGLIYIEGRLPKGLPYTGKRERTKKRKSKYKDIKKPKG